MTGNLKVTKKELSDRRPSVILVTNDFRTQAEQSYQNPHMKKLRAIATGTKFSATTRLSLVVIAAVTFWFAASRIGVAQSPSDTCTVCHKRVQTLTLDCSSLDYRRHLDHGDPQRACNTTPTQNP